MFSHVLIFELAVMPVNSTLVVFIGGDVYIAGVRHRLLLVKYYSQYFSSLFTVIAVFITSLRERLSALPLACRSKLILRKLLLLSLLRRAGTLLAMTRVGIVLLHYKAQKNR